MEGGLCELGGGSCIALDRVGRSSWSRVGPEKGKQPQAWSQISMHVSDMGS